MDDYEMRKKIFRKKSQLAGCIDTSSHKTEAELTIAHGNVKSSIQS